MKRAFREYFEGAGIDRRSTKPRRMRAVANKRRRSVHSFHPQGPPLPPARRDSRMDQLQAAPPCLVNETLRGALVAAFPSERDILLFEVHDPRSRRRADALLVRTHPTFNYEIHQIEMKATRGDWHAERGNPTKAEPFTRVTNRSWIVAAAGVVRVSELAEGWGLLVLRGNALVTEREATLRKPAPLGAGLLATIVRRAYGVSPDCACQPLRSSEPPPPTPGAATE